MGRRDKADGVDVFRLKFQHHLRHPLERDFVLPLFSPILADLEVLTVNAAEVAIAEKDISDAVRSAERRLFAEMLAICGDYGEIAGIAPCNLVPQAIVAAVMRTDSAGFKQSLEPLQTAPEFARCKEWDVRWDKCHSPTFVVQ